ncbi:hypothetical protein HDU79_005269 [Rhizoclosmatium sp. JEL0117]|nr:hypothetical protein HDU79_005269 [Rhizoclosmatium sp. JEL0117]
MATSLVQVKQGAAGVVTATLYLTSGYLSGVSSRDDTIVVEFDYSDTATMLCQTTGSLDKSPCPLSMLSLRSCASVSCTGPAPAVDGSSTESMAASISICPSTNLSCGQNQDLITSDLFTFAGSGGGGSPGGANTPDLPAKTRTTTTVGAGKATTTTTGGNGVVTTTTKAGISTATIDATATVSTTASTPADNSSGSNTTLIGVGVGVGVAIIMAIGILCFFRRSVSKERMNRADFGPEGSKPMTAAPLPKNPAFNSSAPVKLDELERAERAAKDAPSARMPLFVPQQPVQQQQQPVYVAQYVPVPVVVAPQQPTQYPGYYDEQGQYHYFTQEQLAAQYAQAQVQQGLEVHPHPEAQQYQRQPRPVQQ